MTRRTKYSARLFEEICERISEGETLSAICRSPGMPVRSTVFRWIQNSDELSQRIARARELGFDALADQVLAIADTPEDGERVEQIATTKVSGTRVVRADMLEHRKLQCWARLQLLEKWCPSRYGKKAQVEVSDPNEAARKMSDTERAARISAILEAARIRKEQEEAQDGNDDGRS